MEGIGGTVPEPYRRGWIDRVGGLPLVQLRFQLAGQGFDVDLFPAETAFQRALLARRRWEKVARPISGLLRRAALWNRA